MGERLQRCLAPVRGLAPGQYTVETATGRPAICCKGCGTISELGTTHSILMAGIVVPRWVCEHPGCGHAEFITLGDIDEAVLR